MMQYKAILRFSQSYHEASIRPTDIRNLIVGKSDEFVAMTTKYCYSLATDFLD
jgi:hypothetical protein